MISILHRYESYGPRHLILSFRCCCCCCVPRTHKMNESMPMTALELWDEMPSIMIMLLLLFTVRRQRREWTMNFILKTSISVDIFQSSQLIHQLFIPIRIHKDTPNAKSASLPVQKQTSRSTRHSGVDGGLKMICMPTHLVICIFVEMSIVHLE